VTVKITMYYAVGKHSTTVLKSFATVVA